MRPRLSLQTLGSLPPAVQRPAYRVGDARVGVVHLGLGAFHRAHQAVYLDDCLGRGAEGWAVSGVSLRSSRTADALAPQDTLYTLLVRDGVEVSCRVIGSVREALAAPSDPGRVLSRMVDDPVRIVTLTVTEKGYCRDPARGTLDIDHPDIRADLRSPGLPRSAPGFIVEALRRRRENGTSPFTVLSCDNLPGNGETLRRVTVGFAALADPDLARWIENEVAFPSTMVDRIVPASSSVDRDDVYRISGLDDAMPVVAETHSQWVVEDRFTAGRPPLDEVGVQLVADVQPFETLKLRLLNGPHSLLAYLGALAGIETIAQTVAQPDFARAAEGFVAESATTVKISGQNPLEFGAIALRRFANPALRHRTVQVAMDGSQKLPQRMIATVRERLETGMPVEWLALGVAAWMRYATGVDEAGARFAVDDPLADRFEAIVTREGLLADRLVPAFLSIESIFDPTLAAAPALTVPVTRYLEALLHRGVVETVARLVRN